MELIRYEAAKTALKEYKRIDDVKQFRDKAIAVEAYAKQAKDRQLECDASECRFRAERRLGELLVAMQESGERQRHTGRPQTNGSAPNPLTLGKLGIDKRLADASRAAAAIEEERFEEILETHRENQERVTAATIKTLSKGAHVGNNSGNDEWYTPAEFVDAARETMGSIDTDPASCKHAQKTIKAGVFFTDKSDGLSYEWHGNVWLNPPYGSGVIDKFMSHLVDERVTGNVSQAVTLTNNATETDWFQSVARIASAICMVEKRIKFETASGPHKSPLQGQCAMYIGTRVKSFTNHWSDLGVVWVK